MKKRDVKNRPSGQKGLNNKKKFLIDHDTFFDSEEKGSKRRRKMEEDDEDIESSSEEDSDEEGEFGSGEKAEDVEEETAGEKRLRVSKDYLYNLRAIQERKELEDIEAEASEDEEKERVEREGKRDSRIAKILQQEQLEESGRVRRAIASRSDFYCKKWKLSFSNAYCFIKCIPGEILEKSLFGSIRLDRGLSLSLRDDVQDNCFQFRWLLKAVLSCNFMICLTFIYLFF